MALFDYNLSVSGDCQGTSSGAYQISFYGAIPPYTLQFISPTGFTTSLGENVPYSQTGFTPQTIQLTVNDSTLPVNQSFNINIPISSGLCCSVVAVDNTTCGSNNGSVIP